MALPPLLRELVEDELDSFFLRRIPRRIRDRMRLEHTVRGNSVTVVERRPPWRGGGEWTSSPVAQLRYDQDSGGWSLYCRDRNRRWHLYELASPTADIGELIAAIDRDETGIFWG